MPSKLAADSVQLLNFQMPTLQLTPVYFLDIKVSFKIFLIIMFSIIYNFIGCEKAWG